MRPPLPFPEARRGCLAAEDKALGLSAVLIALEPPHIVADLREVHTARRRLECLGTPCGQCALVVESAEGLALRPAVGVPREDRVLGALEEPSIEAIAGFLVLLAVQVFVDL